MLRQVQRDLRDHFMGYAEQMNRSHEGVPGGRGAIGAEHHGRPRSAGSPRSRPSWSGLEELRTQVRTLLPATRRPPAQQHSAA